MRVPYDARMQKKQRITERRLADAWAELQNYADQGNPLEADAYRLAFADPEFLLRRETRGIRFQLELLKPDLGHIAAGIENTVVVYGSARFLAPEVARAELEIAQANGDAQALATEDRAEDEREHRDHREERNRIGRHRVT